MSTQVWGISKWNKLDADWNIDQLRRVERAKLADCTPLSVSLDQKTAEFMDEGGVHQTKMDMCSCLDFNKRNKPCRHMYRLAMELGIMDGYFVTGKSEDIIQPTVKHFAPFQVVVDFEGGNDACAETMPTSMNSPKNWMLVLILSIAVGILGAHRFFVGKYGTGVLMLLSAGGAGIWWIVDIITVATNNFTDSQGKIVRQQEQE